MQRFAYARPPEEGEALALAAQPDTSVIAGGTELLNWMRLGIAAPRRLVDIGRLRGRDRIDIEDGVLRIGALATLNDVGEHPLIQAHAAVLAEACLAAASAQLRNRATLGGNVLQRTRCPYFRAEGPLPAGCNKRRPGSGCSAQAGVSDEGAIFGWTAECVATHPSDPLVALACLDAEVELASAAGGRRLAVRDLHLTQEEAREAGADPAGGETALRPGELIVGYRVSLEPGARSSYVKVRERRSYAFALVSAAACARVEAGRIASLRIGLGGVAQRPWRLLGAEAELAGSPPAEEAIAAAIERDVAAARPLPGNGYKLRLARNAAVRAVVEAIS